MTFVKNLLLFLLLLGVTYKVFSAPINEQTENLRNEDQLNIAEDKEDSTEEDNSEESGDDDTEGSGVVSELSKDKSGMNKTKLLANESRILKKRSNLLNGFEEKGDNDFEENGDEVFKRTVEKDNSVQVRTCGCGCCCKCNGKSEHKDCHQDEECCCHCHHGHHEECCNHCHHGHHHGFIHEWGYEEGGEHHGHIGCEDCHHCHEHCHDHHHHDDHHDQCHHHHEPECCCGWGKKNKLPTNPIAFHCQDIVSMQNKKVLKRFCLPVGYAGFLPPYQQSYSMPDAKWRWDLPAIKNNIQPNNIVNLKKTGENILKNKTNIPKSLKQKRHIVINYDGNSNDRDVNRDEHFIQSFHDNKGEVPSASDIFYNDNTDFLERRSGIISKKENEIPYERGITRRYFQGSFEDGIKAGIYVSFDEN